MRNWLSANRERFHQLILRPVNEFLRSLNLGIAATSSDPFMVTDPDLIVPALEPCWLTRMNDIMARHPDFGLLGVGLDQSNLPAVQEPESIAPGELVDGEIVERPVGSVFTLIRRSALRSSYETDWATCQSVARAGYRYGWAPEVRAHHLGWDDFRLLSEPPREQAQVRRVPRGGADRAPADACRAGGGGPGGGRHPRGRRAGRRDPRAHLVGAGAGGGRAGRDRAGAPGRAAASVRRRRGGRRGARGSPRGGAAALLEDAARVATNAVVAVAGLDAFEGRSAGQLAPAGWAGHEAPGPGDLTMALARAAGADPEFRRLVGVSTIDDRERWLELFATGALGADGRRLWVWKPDPAPAIAAPAAVRFDARPRAALGAGLGDSPAPGTLAGKAGARARAARRARGHGAPQNPLRARVSARPQARKPLRGVITSLMVEV